MLLISKTANMLIPSENIDMVQIDTNGNKSQLVARIGTVKYLIGEYDSSDAAKDALLDIAAAWHEPIALRVSKKEFI